MNISEAVCVVTIVVLVLVFLGSIIHILKKERKYQEHIKIFLYSKAWGKKIFFSEEKDDESKEFDAFISFSHHDEKFVEEILLPGLETTDPKQVQYKCLIHTRDWKGGT